MSPLAPPASPSSAPATAPTQTASYEHGRTPGAQATASAVSTFARGAVVHRYIILDLVGEGGMGVVYAAYDPSLDRRVALKFLRPHEADRDGVRETRLLREAQAMARLSHPNVAVAYEVATFRGRVFLAMEFVDGVDLRTWLAAKPRSFAHILEVFRAAGRGLAAAHAAGIIHRDFKPENVLIDKHHRPRVTDFGLSRAARDLDEGDPEPVQDEPATALSSPSHLSRSLTLTGSFLGTPSYMPPEQQVKGAVDARGDQFSFCVALYESLYREHPFEGSPIERMSKAIAGKVSAAPAHASVPRWCRQALLRGLAPSPENRFPSMEALIAALSPRPMSRRRQLAIAAALGVIVTGASAYAFLPGRSAATPGPRCDLGAQRLAGVWDQARKSQLREAFQQSGARGADLTWKSFSAIVDERAGAWAAMHDQACAATHVEGAQSPAVLDLRMECLERKRQEMKTLVDVYAEKPDAAALDRAVAAADKLSSISPCADVTNLRAVVPLPDDAPTRAKVQELRQSLGQSRALEQAGRYQQGRDYMVSLKREADAVGYAPVAAEAANALAAHLSLAGKTAEAEKVLFEAAAKAVEGRDWTLEAEIWLALLANYARAGRIEDGLLSARVAELAVERANGDNAMRALLANNIADAVANSGNLVDALRRYQQAEDLWRKSLNVGSPQYASLLRDLGDVLNGLGRIRQGLDCVERALAIQRAMLRADHPDIADSVQAVGVTHVILGRFQTGREMVQSALEILLRELGPEHVLTMHALQVTAYIESYFGNSDRALELFSRLLATQHRKLNPADPLLAITYFGMGEAQRLAGRSDEAEGSFERVIELNARGGIPEHLGTGYALTSLGRIHNGRGDDTRALRECRHGLDILTRSLGQGSSRLIDSQECIGEALMARGDFAAARHELEHALTTIAEGDLGPQYTAGARFQLTRALWHTPEDRPRALELARTTLSELTAAEGDNRKMIARIKAWLSAHD